MYYLFLLSPCSFIHVGQLLCRLHVCNDNCELLGVCEQLPLGLCSARTEAVGGMCGSRGATGLSIWSLVILLSHRHIAFSVGRLELFHWERDC